VQGWEVLKKEQVRMRMQAGEMIRRWAEQQARTREPQREWKR
jgi:hypothetical protein